MTSLKQVWHPRLGRHVRFHDRQSLKKGHPHARASLHGLLKAGVLPVARLPIDWTKGWSLPFPMDLNDQLGDCMVAAACHVDNAWTGMSGKESAFDLNAVRNQYLAASGGDNGLDEGTLLQKVWKPGLGGDPAATYEDALDVDVTNAALVQAMMALFGPLVFMFDVPDAWINSFDPSGGSVWDAPAVADKNNGHGVAWAGVDAQGRYRLLTWGSYAWLTPAAVPQVDPSGFAVFSLRMFDARGYAPNGKHYTELAPLWHAAGGKVLPPSPFPAPSPPPGPTPAPPPAPAPVPADPAAVIAVVDAAFAQVEKQVPRYYLPLLRAVNAFVDKALYAQLGGGVHAWHAARPKGLSLAEVLAVLKEVGDYGAKALEIVAAVEKILSQGA